MKLVTCKQCGSSEFFDVPGFRICKYCNCRFALFTEDVVKANTTIELHSDVQRLLEKCKREPAKARKYANLILDIDPTNTEARKYL